MRGTRFAIISVESNALRILQIALNILKKQEQLISPTLPMISRRSTKFVNMARRISGHSIDCGAHCGVGAGLIASAFMREGVYTQEAIFGIAHVIESKPPVAS